MWEQVVFGDFRTTRHLFKYTWCSEMSGLEPEEGIAGAACPGNEDELCFLTLGSRSAGMGLFVVFERGSGSRAKTGLGYLYLRGNCDGVLMKTKCSQATGSN